MVGVEYNVKIRDLEPLTEGHWAVWSREVKFSFLEAGIVHYLDESYVPTEGDTKKTQLLESYQLTHHRHPGKTCCTCLSTGTG